MKRNDLASVLLGVGVGALLTGLVLPFAVDGPSGTTDVATASGGGAPEAAERDPSSVGTPEELALPAGEEAPAPDPGAPAPGIAGAPAPGSPDAVAPQGTGPGRPARAASGGAAVQGVTDTTIKIGFLLLDVGQLSRFGVSAPVVDPELLRDAYQAFIDEMNDRGGFHGRKLEAFYRTFEITSPESQRAACLGLTEDEKVFVVVGEFPDRSANLCVTQEHGTLFLTPGLAGLADDVYLKSRGLLFGLYPRGSRQMADLANDLDRMGKLRGKRIGIVNQRSNDPAGQVGDALVENLRRLGHEVVRRVDFSGDNGEAASAVPVQVQQMRASGADTVVLIANTIVNTQFTQAADAQGWRPTYFMTDWNYMNTDTAAQNLPPSMDGTLGLTYGRAYEHRANIPEGPVSRTCVETFRRRSGRTTSRPETSYQSAVFACAHAGQLRVALQGAGPGLTRESFATALQAAGPIGETEAWWGPGTYRPGKFDYVDQLRSQQWRASCRCWHPVGPFRQP